MANTLKRKVNGEMPQLKGDWTEELQTSCGGLHIQKLHYLISTPLVLIILVLFLTQAIKPALLTDLSDLRLLG